MNQHEFSLIPKAVPTLETAHRRICTAIPHPDSVAVIQTLRRYEPESMNDQLPAVWDHAEGYNVFDKWGNKWIDFSSTIFVANTGHAHPHVRKRLQECLDKPLLNNYNYPSEIRAKLVKALIESTPEHLDRVLLLTTGAEANEAALKMALIRGRQQSHRKRIIVGHIGNFHGKTMGATLAGGVEKGKHWLPERVDSFLHLPFPTPWYMEGRHTSGAECFKSDMDELIRQRNIKPDDIAGFLLESYQGWGAVFYPADYVQALADYARSYHAALIFDEVQSGFGRTGKFFAFEHYGVKPDLVIAGKAIASCLPLSAVLGRREFIDIDPSFNSTHGGNPLSCAAALATLEVFQQENLVAKAVACEAVMRDACRAWQAEHPERIRRLSIRGAVGAVYFYKPGTDDLDIVFVERLIERALQKGLMSIRTSCGTVKIGAPLTIPLDALAEGINVMRESMRELLAEDANRS